MVHDVSYGFISGARQYWIGFGLFNPVVVVVVCLRALVRLRVRRVCRRGVLMSSVCKRHFDFGCTHKQTGFI